MKKKLLLSYKKYRALNHSVPYIFNIQKNGQRLLYFGCKHSFDIKDPQIKKIDAQWKAFLKSTKGKNCVVLVEGGKRKTFTSKKSAVKDSGEMGYVTYLANQAEIETFSPEPTAEYRYSELLEKFSKEETAYYDFALVCYQWNRHDRKPNFKNYVERFLKNDQKNSGWKGFDFSLKNMLKIHKNLFGTKFDENNKNFFRDILDPLSKKSVINKISLFEESGLRDGYIAEKIENYWKKGFNIFVIHGASHAVMQEQVIREFTGSR